MSKRQNRNRHLGVAIFVTAVGTCCWFSTAQVPSTINIQINPTNSASFLLSLENISSTNTYTYVASTSLVNEVFSDDLGVRLGVTAQVDLVVIDTNNPVRFFVARSSSEEDFDGDALSNQDEFGLHGTDPEDPDTDNDGMMDGFETRIGLNPLVNDATNNPDGDSFSNLVESQNNTDPRVPTTLGDFVQEVELMKSRVVPATPSGGYLPPSPSDLTNFNNLASMLLAGEITNTLASAPMLSYELVEFLDTNFTMNLYGLREIFPDGTNGWGFYYTNLDDYDSDVLIEAPHPLFDSNTPEIAAKAFLRSRARFWSMGGSHRNANGEGTANLSGLSTSIFQEVHRAWNGVIGEVTPWQIHGFDISGSAHSRMPAGTDAVLSNGDGGISPELATLNSNFSASGFAAYAFHEYPRNHPLSVEVNGNTNGGSFCSLAALKTTQKIYSKGLGGEFVHIEMEQSIRFNAANRDTAATLIADSIRANHPADPDRDRDGLPTSWEIAHGFNPDGPSDAMGDPDKDGYGNIYEYGGGFVPTNAASIPASAMVLTPGQSIQTAIDDAHNYDVIHLSDGTYSGTVDMNIKPPICSRLIVMSENGPSNRVYDLEAMGSTRGFNFTREEDERWILRGITIRNGRISFGAGIRCGGAASSPTIENCVIENCISPNGDGGGIYVTDGSCPLIVGCTIRGNRAEGSTRDGGGIGCRNQAAPIIKNCIIVDNNAQDDGGGIGSNLSAKPVIENCVIVSNICSDKGGGIYGANKATSTVHNCTIALNAATNAGASGGGVYHFNTAPTEAKNCIIWTNKPNQIAVSSGNVNVDYSCVQGGVPGGTGTGNIGNDPLFTNALIFLIATNSPCIDAGDPSTIVDPDAVDINGDPRILGGRIEMGADEVR